MRITHRTIGLLVGCATLLAATLVSGQDWPQWRGPNRDNKIVGFSVPKEWPKELTKKWKGPVGIGEASPVLVGDKVYTFGRIDGDEVTLCLDAATGKEIWRDKNPAAAFKKMAPDGGYPGPRSTPAVGEGKVCTLGVHGVVTCLDAGTGKVAWRKEVTPKLQFHTSTSPIIVDGKCIVFVGGALTAFDLASGDSKSLWPGAGDPYGSPVLTVVDGVKQVVTPASGVLVGINLADGKKLWEVKLPAGYQSTYSTPLAAGARVFYSVAGGKGGGGGMFALKIEKKGDGFTANETWNIKLAAGGYHTPLLSNERIYGVSAGKQGSFFCLDAKTGEKIWTDDTSRGQCGSILDAGPVLLSLTSNKDLLVFKSDEKKYVELAKYRVSDSETWCVPIVAGNRVYVKDKGGTLALLTID